MIVLEKNISDIAFEKRESLFLKGLIPPYKDCTKCKENKHYTEYNLKYRGKQDTTELNSCCKKCANKSKKEYSLKTITKEELEKNNQNSKKWHHTNKDSVKVRILLRTYGLSLIEYNSLIEKQNNSCAICGTHQSQLTKVLCVDHNHETGKVRGLLCNSCNMALGQLKDSVLLIEKALNYLKTNN